MMFVVAKKLSRSRLCLAFLFGVAALVLPSLAALAGAPPLPTIAKWSPNGDLAFNPPQSCYNLSLSGAQSCYDNVVKASPLYPYMTSTGWALNIFSGGYDFLECYSSACISVGPQCTVGAVDYHFIGQCLVIFHRFKERDTGCTRCQGPQQATDPINTASGNKFETVTDYRGAGPFPLTLSRTFNSVLATEGYSPGQYSTGENLGPGWTSSIGAHLYVNPMPLQVLPCVEPINQNQFLCFDSVINPPLEVTIWHADGSQDWFELSTPPQTLAAGTVFSNEQVGDGQLAVVNLPAPNTGTGFQFLRTDGYVELYNSSGQLLSVTNPNGLAQTYQYNTGSQVASVTDPFGRQLTFTYDANGRISSVINPIGGVYTYTYGASGNLTSVQYPDQSSTQYVYGENGAPPNALTGIIDEDGNRFASWGYDPNGQAISGSNAGNTNSATISYTNDSAGGITSATVTEATGLVRTLTFTNINGVNLLTSSSAPCPTCGDKTKSLTYDANGFIARKTDFDGNVTLYTHDGFGNETSRTEAYGTASARTISTQWNLQLNQPALITEPGRTTAYSYDTQGRMLSKTVTDTVTIAVRTTSYAYNGLGLLGSVTDPMGNVTNYSYDPQGNLSSVTNALNQVTQITQYDANGMPLTIVDPNGVITTLTYDPRQRLLTRTVAGATTRFAYDKVGNLTQVTLPTGSFLKYSYDAAHRLTGISDAVGDSIAYTLDNLGNRTSEKTCDPSNTLTKTLSRTYNNLNQLTKVVGGAGQTTSYTPDQNGNVTGITDPMTYATRQTFDALNHLASVVDPENGHTSYSYDPLDRVTQVTDPKGLGTTYSYDAFGDVTNQVNPDTGTTSYTYDLNGNRLSKTDANGFTTTYSYDVLNRLTAIGYLDPNLNVTYSYDQGTNGIGHLTGMTDKSGSTTYSYDAHGNTLQKTVTLNGHVFNVGYQYDTADNLIGMTYPSGLQVSYVRDTAERVTAVTANNNTVVSGVSYAPFGPVTTLTYGNGLTESRTYDQDYRLMGITVPGVLKWTFQDNADNDITSITDTLNSSNSQSLGYDNLNRLTLASGLYGTQSYAYDLDGNRTQQTLGSTGTLLSYDTASNHLLTVGSAGYQYDPNGNLLYDSQHNYNYDASNRLTGYDSVAAAYLYNGLGQRAAKFAVTKDTTPPTVAIISPSNGASVSGTISITANATDNVAVASVQFQLDGISLGTAVTAAPYSISWNTATATPGTHSLTAVATDTSGNSATSATVTVTVADVPATATNGSLSTPVGTTGSGTLAATPAYSAQTLTFAIVASPAHGTVTLTANTGAFTYTPVAGYAGNDSFTFSVTDSFGTVSNTATESLTVTDVAATANNGSLSTPVGTAVSGALVATPAYTGQTLMYALTTNPTHGAVTITNARTGTFTYTPAAGYVGGDNFTFQATDAYGTVSNIATESLTITDLAATANNGNLSTSAGIPVSGSLSATLAYAGQTLTYGLATSPIHGAVTVTNATTGAFTYTPALGYAGADSFTFKVTDSYGMVSNTATDNITVTDVAATATNGNLSTQAGVTATGSLAATPAYTGQTLTFAIIATPAHGSVSLTNATTGAVTYTPAVGYAGADSFTFSVTDSYGIVSNTATENVTVTDLPATTNNGGVSTSPDMSVNGTLSATPAYNGQTLTFSLVASPPHGTVTITDAGTGAFSYTPTVAYVGSDSFTFKVTDAYGTASNTASESVTVSDVAPAANSGSISVTKNRSVSGSLSATPAYNGQNLTFNVVSNPANGTVTITNTSTGAFTYTPEKGYEGADGFTFSVTDQWGTVSRTATETVSVVSHGHGHK